MDVGGVMEDLTLSQKRAIAGAKGGRATVKKYGKRYMKKLAKWGAHRMHSKYALVPVNLNDFALVHRQEGTVKAYLSGKPVEDECRFVKIPVEIPEYLENAL
jgi:hypothetical protein